MEVLAASKHERGDRLIAMANKAAGSGGIGRRLAEKADSVCALFADPCRRTSWTSRWERPWPRRRPTRGGATWTSCARCRPRRARRESSGCRARVESLCAGAARFWKTHDCSVEAPLPAEPDRGGRSHDKTVRHGRHKRRGQPLPRGRATAFSLGQAVTYLLAREERRAPQVVIGRDTRVSGHMLECALAAGVASMGGVALLAGVLPTPAIAFLTVALEADAGAVISASHNPFHDNGIKFFSASRFQTHRRPGGRDRAASAERLAAGVGTRPPRPGYDPLAWMTAPSAMWRSSRAPSRMDRLSPG